MYVSPREQFVLARRRPSRGATSFVEGRALFVEGTTFFVLSRKQLLGRRALFVVWRGAPVEGWCRLEAGRFALFAKTSRPLSYGLVSPNELE